jgi:hypothetical protein
VRSRLRDTPGASLGTRAGSPTRLFTHGYALARPLKSPEGMVKRILVAAVALCLLGAVPEKAPKLDPAHCAPPASVRAP